MKPLFIEIRKSISIAQRIKEPIIHNAVKITISRADRKEGLSLVLGI